MPDLSDLNEHARPHAPKIPGATEAHRRQGRVLAMIHAAHLNEMVQIRALVKHIEDGPDVAKQLAEAVPNLKMTRNLQNFGALCGRECNNLFFHHNMEEQKTFPILEARGNARLRAVVAKLRQEHTVIHALLEQLGERAIAVMRSPDAAGYAALRVTFDTLETVVRSHFGYEETELEEALGVYQAL